MLSGCQQLHLGILTVPQSSQDLTSGVKRRKDQGASKRPGVIRDQALYVEGEEVFWPGVLSRGWY